MVLMTPRPYQTRTLDDCRAAFASGKRAVLVVSPTGSGKTCMGSMMAAGHVQRGGRVVWLAHRVELVDQAARALRSMGLEVGCRGLSPGAPVQVHMVQTLARRDLGPDGTLVVADEAHHFAIGGDWTRVLKGYLDCRARIVGLTATPARADGKALEGFDALVVSTTIAELTGERHLVPVRWLGPDSPTRKDRIQSSPADAWSKHARGRTTVVFAPHVQAMQDYADEFRRLRCRVDVVSDRSRPEERAGVLARLEAGLLDVVVNVQVLTEGWDCPRVSCVIVGRRVGSQALWVQMTGRGLRPHDGKRDCLLIDLCGMAHTLGLPDEPRTYSLDGDGMVLARKGSAPVRLCRVCGVPLGDAVRCEECATDHAQVTPVSLGGDLVEWRARYEAALRELRPSRPAIALAGILRKARSAEKPWKPRAAAIRFRAIFGREPDAETMRQARQLNELADDEFARVVRQVKEAG